eukprot:scaffold38351_cov63-Phaeocystis_antarctica.AAC.15
MASGTAPVCPCGRGTTATACATMLLPLPCCCHSYVAATPMLLPLLCGPHARHPEAEQGVRVRVAGSS